MLHAALHCTNAHHVDLERLFTGLLKHQRHRETVTLFQWLVPGLNITSPPAGTSTPST